MSPIIQNSHFRLNDNNEAVYLRAMAVAEFPVVHDIEIRSYDRTWEDSRWHDRYEYTRVAMIPSQPCSPIVGFWTGLQIGEMVTIERLAVHPQFRNRGVGTILLFDLEKTFPTATTLQIVVEESLVAAPFLLRKNGFICVRNLGKKIRIPGMWEPEYGYEFRKEIVEE